MKLNTIEGETINVSFWSFLKCHILADLALAGIIWIIFVIWLVIVFILAQLF